MNPSIPLAELQWSWTPPDGLGRSRPRPVRLSAAGRALAALAVGLFVGALAAGIALGGIGGREAEQQRILLEQGADAEGRIIRLWRSRGDNKQPWVAYRFKVQARAYERSVKAPLRVWRDLRVGSDLPVRYLPSDPDFSHPRAWRQKTMPVLLPYVVAAALATLSWLVTQTIRSQRRLLAEGRAAPALVTHHTRAKEGKTIHYEFPLLSGAIRKGQSGPSKKPALVGSTICVLYDPDNPRKNAPYPLSLVTPADLRQAAARR